MKVLPGVIAGAAIGAGLALIGWSLAPGAPRGSSVVELEIDGGHGSGVYIDPTHILTAAHVALDAKDGVFAVRGEDGRWVQGYVVLVDKANDIAILETVAAPSWSKLYCDLTIPIGTHVESVGVPVQTDHFFHSFGQITTIVMNVPQGDGSTEPLVGASSVLAPGFSGGPTFNDAGEVVGINDAVVLLGYPAATPIFGESLIVPSFVACEDYKTLTSTPNAGKGVINVKRPAGPALG